MSFSAVPVFAQDKIKVEIKPVKGFEAFERIETGEAVITEVAVRVVSFIMAFSGVIAMVFVIYGGWLILLSGGSEEKISGGKKILTWAVIGLAVIFTSYVVMNFVVNTIQKGITGS